MKEIVLILVSVLATSVLWMLLVKGMMKKYDEIHLKSQCSIFTICNKVNHNPEILFVGDSITELYPVGEYFDVKTANRGISSDTSFGVLGRIEDSITNLNPKKMYLLIGTNDFYYKTSQEVILENTKKIIEQTQSHLPSTKIFVGSLYPINKKSKKADKKMVGTRSNEALNNYNKKLKVLCKEMSVTFIEVNSKLCDSEGNLNMDYSTDGLHLNGVGYEVVTKTLQTYLQI